MYNRFRQCPACLLNVLCKFNLRPVTRGIHTTKVDYQLKKSMKMGQEQKELMSAFAYFFTTITKVSLL